jgi:3-methyl-2-oxobutanoate hydroxymethyltransferase
MPFGSYHQSLRQGVKNVTRMVQLSGCDCVKIEASPSHARLIRQLADAGVAVIAHLGLRPQSVKLMGYRSQARTAKEVRALVESATTLEAAGTAAILLEAVPPEAALAVVEATGVPIIGCGAGPACHAHVVVTHDLLGLTNKPPRFVPEPADLSKPLKSAFADYVRKIESGEYPGPGHAYRMDETDFKKRIASIGETHETVEK